MVKMGSIGEMMKTLGNGEVIIPKTPMISKNRLQDLIEFRRTMSSTELYDLIETYWGVHYPNKVDKEVLRANYCGTCDQASPVFYDKRGGCVWCRRYKIDKEITLTCEHWSPFMEDMRISRPIDQIDGDLNVRVLANKASEVVTRINNTDDQVLICRDMINQLQKRIKDLEDKVISS